MSKNRTDDLRLAAFTRRQRKGSEKRQVGVGNIQRMLPGRANGQHGGNVPPGTFSGDTAIMAMEDSYCDMWGREDIIDRRIRSLFTVSMMVAVGRVGNHPELELHAPAAIYNGVTVAELEAIIVQARAYVGSPCAANAMRTIHAAINGAGLIESPLPEADLARRERTGTEKRAIARAVLRDLVPDSPLLDVGDDLDLAAFAPELDHMELELVYFDLWARTHVLDHRLRSIVTLGFVMAVLDHEAVREHVALALRLGVTVAELEELVYQASTYLGYLAGRQLRRTVADAVATARVHSDN